MRYQFPKIEHINDVLPAIQDSPEFIVAEREYFTVINYLVSHPETFPEVDESPELEYDLIAKRNAIRRECRGLIFCKTTGKILRRPFSKFFNIGERDETQLHLLDFTGSHEVFTKEDGSMVTPFEVGFGSGVIRWATKMGLSDVALNAEVFVAENPKYQEFAKWCIANRLTPIFEWVSRKNRIVLDYPEDNLILLAVRHMETGEYLPLKV